MKIAIDISPLSNANSVRGIGYYTKRLVQALKAYAPQHEYHFVNNAQDILDICPDLIHYPYFDPFFLTLPKRNGQPVVVTIHDCIQLQFPQFFPKGIKGWLKLQIQTLKLHQVDALITDSNYSKQDIQKFYKISSSKIHVAPLAVEASFQRIASQSILESIQSKYQLPHKFILKVGDINPTKNFHATFQSIAKIPDAHLVLVGKALVADQEKKPIVPELQSILQDIQTYKLQNRVHRLGFVPDADIPALYTLATATLQNSLYEGFGLPALESLACGTPVISANTSSLPEIVGDIGIQIDPADIDQSASAIKNVLTMEPSAYQKLSDASFIQSQKFSLEKLAHDTVKVYESVTK